MDTRDNENIFKSKEKFANLSALLTQTDMSTSPEDSSLIGKVKMFTASCPLAKYPDRQAIFLKEVQQAIEEGQELKRLSDIVGVALAQTKPSRFTTWWSKPSAFHEALIRYQKQIQLSFPVKSPKRSSFAHRTYGTSEHSPSVRIDISDVDKESSIIDEKTPLLSQPSSQFKRTSKEKTEKKESVDALLASMAEENYTAYQRLITGYRSRTTGILNLEKASQHLITAALQGQMDAARLLNSVPSDPLTVFNSATHQEAWFSAQLKSITPHEPLYSQAQWRLFLLVYSRRYQQGVYADYETRFNELQQAVTYLHNYITGTNKPDTILAAAAKAFLVLDGDERGSIRKSAWKMLKKEIQGQDPLVDWYQRTLQPDLEKKPAASLEATYPFRILPSEALITFCGEHSDLEPIEHKGMARELQRISKQPSFQLQDVEADEKSGYVLTVTKSAGLLGKPKTTVFLDREKKTEVGRVICDGIRFLFYAYGDTVQLTLATSDSCHYYKIHNPAGTLILQATLPEKIQYLEVQAKRCVIAEGSQCWAEKLKIEAEKTDQHGHLKAGTLQLHTVHDLSNYETGQIEAVSDQDGSIPQLRLTGGNIWNAGKIATKGKGVVSLNGIFFHGISSLELLKKTTRQKKWPGTAVLEGGDFTIVAGVYVNLLGRVQLRNGSLMTLVEINLGVGVTVNMTKSRLLAMDGGIDLPHFPQMISDVSSFVESWTTKGFIGALNQLDKFRLVANGLSVVRWFIRTFVPAAGKVTDVAWTAGMFAWSIPGLSQQCQELYQKKQHGKPLEWRDRYALIALGGSMFNQLFFLGSQIKDIVTAKETLSPKTTESDVTTPSSTESSSYWQSPNEPVSMLALNVLALFAPTQTDDAFLKIKSGVHVTGSLLDRSILPIGIGHSAIALNISNLFFCSSIQLRTVQVANNISETGHTLTKSDSMVIANNHFTDLTSQHTSDRMYVKRLFWQTHEYKDKSIISAQEATITSQHQGIHEGTLEARVAIVSSEELTFTAKSQLHAGSIQLKGKHIHHHGQTQGKQVMFIGEATIEDSGYIVAEAMQYQTQEKLTRLPTALLEAKTVIMEGGEGQVVEQGKIHLLSVPLSAATKTSSASTNEKTTLPPAALSIKAKSITLAVESEIDTQGQSSFIKGTDHIEVRGNLVAGDVELTAGMDIELHETATISATDLFVKAPTLSQASQIVVSPKLSDKKLAPDTKTININVELEGSELCEQTAQGYIVSPEGTVLLKSEQTVSDGGHIVAKEAFLNATRKVERLATASLEAEKIDIGTLTSETIDHGTVLLHPSNTSQTNTLGNSSYSAAIRGKQVTLGDKYHLSAEEQSVIVHAEEKLSVSGGLTTGDLQLTAGTDMKFHETAIVSATSLLAKSPTINDSGQIIAKEALREHYEFLATLQ